MFRIRRFQQVSFAINGWWISCYRNTMCDLLLERILIRLDFNRSGYGYLAGRSTPFDDHRWHVLGASSRCRYRYHCAGADLCFHCAKISRGWANLWCNQRVIECLQQTIRKDIKDYVQNLR